jgi:hypothetical protein
MKSIYPFLFLSLGILSCRKSNTTSATESVTVTTPSLPSGNKFVSRSPIYSAPNNTVGQIKNGYYFPGFYKANKEWLQYCVFGPKLNGTGSMNQFAYDATGDAHFDFNKDGILDYFSFLQNFYNPPAGSQGGKYMLIKNLLGETNQEKVYTNSVTRWSVRLEVNDVNGDGTDELIQGSSDGHGLSDGSRGLESPLKIIYFNPEGTFTVKEIGSAMGIHDFTSGDIDNDGDIDILVWRYNTSIGDSRPILFINDGKSNFTQDMANNRFNGIDQILAIYGQYVVTAVELFDLNKDGYLDIITGQNIGQAQSSGPDYRVPNTRVYWGNSKGTFNLTNSFADLPNISITNTSVPISVLGFSFVDYEKDGDFDILTVSTPQYNGFYLQLYENLGDGTFKDVTTSKITGFSQINVVGGTSNNTFPNFYNIRLYDVDKDGDYDLIPDNLAIPPSINIVTNMYWENVNGSYFRRNF